jgi:hypothetical protein
MSGTRRSFQGYRSQERIAMAHNPESARAAVLVSKDEAQRKPLHNPISQIQLVGGAIGGLLVLLLVAVTALMT